MFHNNKQHLPLIVRSSLLSPLFSSTPVRFARPCNLWAVGVIINRYWKQIYITTCTWKLANYICTETWDLEAVVHPLLVVRGKHKCTRVVNLLWKHETLNRLICGKILSARVNKFISNWKYGKRKTHFVYISSISECVPPPSRYSKQWKKRKYRYKFFIQFYKVQGHSKYILLYRNTRQDLLNRYKEAWWTLRFWFRNGRLNGVNFSSTKVYMKNH